MFFDGIDKDTCKKYLHINESISNIEIGNITLNILKKSIQKIKCNECLNNNTILYLKTLELYYQNYISIMILNNVSEFNLYSAIGIIIRSNLEIATNLRFMTHKTLDDKYLDFSIEDEINLKIIAYKIRGIKNKINELSQKQITLYKDDSYKNIIDKAKKDIIRLKNELDTNKAFIKCSDRIKKLIKKGDCQFFSLNKSIGIRDFIKTACNDSTFISEEYRYYSAYTHGSFDAVYVTKKNNGDPSSRLMILYISFTEIIDTLHAAFNFTRADFLEEENAVIFDLYGLRKQ